MVTTHVYWFLGSVKASSHSFCFVQLAYWYMHATNTSFNNDQTQYNTKYNKAT